MIYTGIGARKTPQEILEVMYSIGISMAQQGWTLRSGAALGADSAFEQGCDFARGDKEIYLPWGGFEGHPHNPSEGYYDWKRCKGADLCDDITDRFHPKPDKLSRGPRAMMNRNCMQVLGQGVDVLDKSNLLICWTPGGKGQGGTGQAIRIATHYGVKVRDLGVDKVLTDCVRWLET